DCVDGDNGFGGEGFEQLDLHRGEGAYLDATCDQCSNKIPLLAKGNDQKGPRAAATRNHRRKIVLRVDVWNVERAMLAYPVKLWIINTDPGAAGIGYGTKMSPHNRIVPLVESQDHVIDPANPSRALDDGVEHRLHVRGRAADDAEHFPRGGLMLQGLLKLLEQAHVLDGDNGLVGESLGA